MASLPTGNTECNKIGLALSFSSNSCWHMSDAGCQPLACIPGMMSYLQFCGWNLEATCWLTIQNTGPAIWQVAVVQGGAPGTRPPAHWSEQHACVSPRGASMTSDTNTSVCAPFSMQSVTETITSALPPCVALLVLQELQVLLTPFQGGEEALWASFLGQFSLETAEHFGLCVRFSNWDPCIPLNC